MSEPCPLCSSPGADVFHRDKLRPYLRCPRCKLVFVPREFLLTPEEEKMRYDTHENRPDDTGYRDFLARLAGPVSKRVPKGSRGLDYGSGPGPVLSMMLTELGHDMTDFDPFYAPDPEALERTYDFVTCSETIEHVFDTRGLLDLFKRLVRPGGIIGVMTQMIEDPESFADWHYKRDLTHVRFFSKDTLRWAAREWGFTVEFPGPTVAVLHAPEA